MSSLRLQGQVALITGAGSGIGAATAHVFCQQGAAVFLVDANAQGLASTRQRIEQSMPQARVLCLEADVSDAELALRAVEQCVTAWGGLDLSLIHI
jgi:2-hydroxycyclohexanecarboxyl-CoA dehydrogenase